MSDYGWYGTHSTCYQIRTHRDAFDLECHPLLSLHTSMLDAVCHAFVSIQCYRRWPVFQSPCLPRDSDRAGRRLPTPASGPGQRGQRRPRLAQSGQLRMAPTELHYRINPPFGPQCPSPMSAACPQPAPALRGSPERPWHLGAPRARGGWPGGRARLSYSLSTRTGLAGAVLNATARMGIREPTCDTAVTAGQAGPGPRAAMSSPP